MKVIDLREAKANLDRYAAECRSSPVVVTMDGKPAFEMVPVLSDDPEFIDRLLEHNDAFRLLAEERRRESETGLSDSLAAVRARLLASPDHE